MLKTPCEIIQWNVLPALRKELVLHVVETGLARKDAAKLFDISESAISQYSKAKRGARFSFDSKIKLAITKSAEKIAKSGQQQTVVRELCHICAELKKQKILCKLHHIENPCLSKCNLQHTCRGVC